MGHSKDVPIYEDSIAQYILKIKLQMREKLHHAHYIFMSISHTPQKGQYKHTLIRHFFRNAMRVYFCALKISRISRIRMQSVADTGHNVNYVPVICRASPAGRHNVNYVLWSSLRTWRIAPQHRADRCRVTYKAAMAHRRLSRFRALRPIRFAERLYGAFCSLRLIK